MEPVSGPSTASATPPRRRFVGRNGIAPSRASPGSVLPSAPSQIDPAILNDAALNAAIDALLPKSYNFEIHKTIHQIRHYRVKRVALQMPEGLTMFACGLVDLVEGFGGEGVEAVVMGDVTYGACCVDDYTARALGCDFLVHYGHSCLVPVDQTSIRTLYVFVEIAVDRFHLVDTIRHNFPDCLPSCSSKPSGPAVDISVEGHPSSAGPGLDGSKHHVHLAVVGTVQFIAGVQTLKHDLENPSSLVDERLSRLAITTGHGEEAEIEEMENERRRRRTLTTFKVLVPQVKPLSPGEVLGCTAPKLPKDVDALLYVGDGRFHLESIMIANPDVPAFRYDPYERRITREGYEHDEMRRMRGEAVEAARRTVEDAQIHGRPEVNGGSGADAAAGTEDADDIKPWAVVLGTLGRQGNLSVMKSVTNSLSKTSLPAPAGILLSELSPAKMSLLAPEASAFVQTSCPRLSIDWGYAFPRPLLSPYEAKVALGEAKGWEGMGKPKTSDPAARLETYPMDFYADDSLGDWTPRHGRGVRKVRNEPGRPMPKRKAAAASVAVGPISTT